MVQRCTESCIQRLLVRLEKPHRVLLRVVYCAGAVARLAALVKQSRRIALAWGAVVNSHIVIICFVIVACDCLPMLVPSIVLFPNAVCALALLVELCFGLSSRILLSTKAP